MRKFIFLAVLAFATMAGAVSMQPRAAEANFALINFPTATCVGDNASVTFSWTPQSPVGLQFLDLSVYDNDFDAGTFVAAGGFGPEVGSFTWHNLKAGQIYVWRINTLVNGMWFNSATGYFVPCGYPQLMFGATLCMEDGSAMVTFHWAPSTLGGPIWVDASSFNNGFTPGTYETWGPMAQNVHSMYWWGFFPGSQYYFRVSQLTPAGWLSTFTAPFVPVCESQENQG